MTKTVDYAKKYKNIKVKVSDDTIIAGTINIGDFQRLSDYLKSSNDHFITIFSAEEGNEKKVAIINREHIIWAETWD